MSTESNSQVQVESGISNISLNNSSKTETKPSKYGSTNATVFKYISGKFYHPSTRFEDLRGLSINKTADCDLIQTNSKFIAVPISGPGGRVGIIKADKPGRLPTQVPCVLSGSEVLNFKFNPFDEHMLVTVSVDNKIRVWEIPDGEIKEDIVEPKYILESRSMDKMHLLEFHPTSKGILLTTSDDLGKPTIRIWNLDTRKDEITLTGQHKDVIFSCAWSPDGQSIATISKDKKLRILNARTGDIIAEGPSHNSLRPSRLLWLNQETGLLISVGFGLGSAREVLLYSQDDLSKPVAKTMIDISPGIMCAYVDLDCQILYVAGRGDRTIHTFHIETDTKKLVPLAKIESISLQQGFSFMPKRECNVKDIEIAKFYRLTPTNIEIVGVRVPRARPEYFQDDIFVPTVNVGHAAQDAASWFNGQNKSVDLISLQPKGMQELSTAPPPASQANSKAKFEMGKKFVSDEQRRQEQMERMFQIAKNTSGDEVKPKAANPEDEEVAEDEWDD